MGQKVNPIGLRLGINQEWRSLWYANSKDFGPLLLEDIKVRAYIKKKLFFAGVSKVTIERASNRARVVIHTSRPGIIIGRKGTEIDRLKEDIVTMTGREVVIDIEEVKKPDLDAQLVAENIAVQLEKRISHRRAMKRALRNCMENGGLGIKILVSGRLGGTDIARNESYKDGKIPLHTLRAIVDYGFAEARTTYGTTGVKVWIYKGETGFVKAEEKEEQEKKAAFTAPVS